MRSCAYNAGHFIRAVLGGSEVEHGKLLVRWKDIGAGDESSYSMCTYLISTGLVEWHGFAYRLANGVAPEQAAAALWLALQQ